MVSQTLNLYGLLSGLLELLHEKQDKKVFSWGESDHPSLLGQCGRSYWMIFLPQEKTLIKLFLYILLMRNFFQ